MKKLLLIFFALLLTSCLSRGTTERLYSPSGPYERDVWKKEGATDVEIRKALFECGLSPRGIPGMSGGFLEADKNDHPGPSEKGYLSPKENRYILSILCMEGSGFTSMIDSYNYYCTWFSHNPFIRRMYLPACQPGVVPPKRSVERRLNSNYCRTENARARNWPACEP
jgi:hypothetical protein